MSAAPPRKQHDKAASDGRRASLSLQQEQERFEEEMYLEELEADAEEDMAEEEERRRDVRQRFRNRMAGTGPDGEGLRRDE